VIYPMVAEPILFQSPAMNMVTLFCDLNNFYQAFAPTWQLRLLPAPGRHRRRASRLSTSEIMTLVIVFQDSDDRTFQHFYWQEVCPLCKRECHQARPRWFAVCAYRWRSCHFLRQAVAPVERDC
jgi:hypothetical protein